MVNFLKTIKIGKLAIKKTAVLAPMASVADRSYRLMCKKFGAGLVFSEMISVKGICYNLKKTENLLKITKEERPMALQLFGEDPKYFELALDVVLKHQPDIIDINMGCPVRKVVRNGAGSSLMKDVKLAEKIARVVVKNSNVPVSVKIRKGWDDENVNAIEFAKAMQNCGVSAITVHGRTKEQMFSGKADWDIVEKIKKSVNIPIILSGDVKTVKDVKAAYEKTDVDLVMIGRATFGRPWIFEQIIDFLSTGKFKENVSVEFVLDVLLEHVKKIFEYEEYDVAVRKTRSVAMRYLTGFKNAAKFRKMCCGFCSFEDVLKFVDFVRSHH